MQAVLRDTFELARIYIVGAIAAFGWLLIGVYVYLRPVPLDTNFGTDFNHDIGTALIAQGLIFFVTFSVSGAIRIGRGRHEQEEAAKDRQMLRAMYQWMEEQHRADATSQASDLPISSGNKAKSEGEVSHLN